MPLQQTRPAANRYFSGALLLLGARAHFSTLIFSTLESLLPNRDIASSFFYFRKAKAEHLRLHFVCLRANRFKRIGKRRSFPAYRDLPAAAGTNRRGAGSPRLAQFGAIGTEGLLISPRFPASFAQWFAACLAGAGGSRRLGPLFIKPKLGSRGKMPREKKSGRETRQSRRGWSDLPPQKPQSPATASWQGKNERVS